MLCWCAGTSAMCDTMWQDHPPVSLWKRTPLLWLRKHNSQALSSWRSWVVFAGPQQQRWHFSDNSSGVILPSPPAPHLMHPHVQRNVHTSQLNGLDALLDANCHLVQQVIETPAASRIHRYTFMLKTKQAQEGSCLLLSRTIGPSGSALPTLTSKFHTGIPTLPRERTCSLLQTEHVHYYWISTWDLQNTQTARKYCYIAFTATCLWVSAACI